MYCVCYRFFIPSIDYPEKQLSPNNSADSLSGNYITIILAPVDINISSHLTNYSAASSKVVISTFCVIKINISVIDTVGKFAAVVSIRTYSGRRFCIAVIDTIYYFAIIRISYKMTVIGLYFACSKIIDAIPYYRVLRAKDKQKNIPRGILCQCQFRRNYNVFYYSSAYIRKQSATRRKRAFEFIIITIEYSIERV